MKQEIKKHSDIKNKLYLLLLVFGCMQSVAVKAVGFEHIFTYSYDNAGNRYLRAYTVAPHFRLANPSLKDSTQLDSLYMLAQKDADTIAITQQEFIKNAVAEGELKVVYPNPTKGNVYIDFTNDLPNTKIELYDLKGNLLSELSMSGANLQVDLSLFANGEYLMRIKTVTGKIYTRKIIKF